MKETDIFHIPCSECNECRPCPAGINIPEVFGIYNRYLQGEKKEAEELYQDLEHQAGECIRCTFCEIKCKKRIGISAMMFEIAEEMEQE